MTTHLILISHAPTSATVAAAFPSDEPLEPPIAALPDLSAEIEKAGPFDHALLGPERRVVETAAALGLADRGVVDPGLRECSYGRWTGRRLRDVGAEEPAAVADWLKNPAASPHGGESITELIERVGTWLDERGRVGGRVVAVTHPAVVRAAVVCALQAAPDTFWRVDVGPLAWLDIRGGMGRWNLRGLRPAAQSRS
jgi:broad specificity phosphatase PhoE